MSKEVIWSGNGEQPNAALCVRNIKTREGYDYWDKLCAIPRYGFIHSPDNSRVLKAEGIGNWIDQHAAQEVMDDAQSEVNQLRAERDALLAERDRMAKALRKIKDAQCKSSPTATDFGISWDRGMLIGTMKDIARAALQGEQP